MIPPRRPPFGRAACRARLQLVKADSGAGGSSWRCAERICETPQRGLDTLQADGGGDYPESAWSGMTEALRLPWRPGVQKVLINMADAPARDPEPVTGLTAADVITLALEIDPVQVYTVDVGGASNMRTVSEQTGGAYLTRASGDVPTLISRSPSTALAWSVPTAVYRICISPCAGQQPWAAAEARSCGGGRPSGPQERRQPERQRSQSPLSATSRGGVVTLSAIHPGCSSTSWS
jgi:hypothetical protein